MESAKDVSHRRKDEYGKTASTAGKTVNRYDGLTREQQKYAMRQDAREKLAKIDACAPVNASQESLYRLTKVALEQVATFESAADLYAAFTPMILGRLQYDLEHCPHPDDCLDCAWRIDMLPQFRNMLDQMGYRYE